MRLTNLKRVPDYVVQEWLEKSIRNLTSDQKRWMINEEIIRFSPFYFYEFPKKQSISFIWRITILFFPIYLVAILVFLPFKFITTGEWGYGQKFYDNFHAKWLRKIGI